MHKLSDTVLPNTILAQKMGLITLAPSNGRHFQDNIINPALAHAKSTTVRLNIGFWWYEKEQSKTKIEPRIHTNERE